MEALKLPTHDARTEACKSAFDRALAAYRESDVVSLGSRPTQ